MLFFIEGFYRKPGKRLSLLVSNNDGPETMRSAEFPKMTNIAFFESNTYYTSATEKCSA